MISRARQTIQAELKKIRRAAHPECVFQIGTRGDYADYTADAAWLSDASSFLNRQGRDHSLHILGENVELEIYEIAAFCPVKIRMASSCRG